MHVPHLPTTVPRLDVSDLVLVVSAFFGVLPCYALPHRYSSFTDKIQF